jgi:GNAT superfamily N-acetyltransferase
MAGWPSERGDPRDVAFRHPIEADHPAVARCLDEWCDGGAARYLVPRLWTRHLGGTSWLAEAARGEKTGIVGFLFGFVSPARPDLAAIHAIGVAPGVRRRGIGRALVDRFVAGVQEQGVASVESVMWAGDPSAVAFHRALGFEADDGPETVRLYGTHGFADYDTLDDDKVRFVRSLPVERRVG